MNAIKFSIFLLGCFMLSCTASTPRTNPITDMFEEDQERIKKMLVDIFEVARAKNMESLDTYHLNSPKFSKFDDGEIPQRQDYEMAKRTEEELFTSISGFDYELPDVKVDVFDDVAITTFILDYSVGLGDTTLSAKSRGTLVFVKDGDAWKIAHEHFSPYMEAQN